MQPLEALEAAIAVSQQVLDAGPIRAEDLGAPTPCASFDLAQLGDHVIDTHNLLLGAAGGRPVDPGTTLAERHAQVGAAAVKQWIERGTDGTIDLGGNALPAAFGLSLHALEAYVHAWDLARALDRPFRPGAELTAHIADVAQQIVTDQARGDEGAPYRAALTAGEGDDDVARLIAHTGRDPHGAVRT